MSCSSQGTESDAIYLGDNVPVTLSEPVSSTMKGSYSVDYGKCSKIQNASLRQLTLKKGAPGDQVSDLLCMQVDSYLKGGPLMLMMHLHINLKKSNYDGGFKPHCGL